MQIGITMEYTDSSPFVLHSPLQLFQVLTVSISINGCASSQQKVEKKWSFSVPEDFSMLVMMILIFLLTMNVCHGIALTVTYSQEYSEIPIFHLLHNAACTSCHPDFHNMQGILTPQLFDLFIIVFLNFWQFTMHAPFIIVYALYNCFIKNSS